LIVHTDVQTEISNKEGLFSMSSFMLRSSLWVCVLMWLWPPFPYSCSRMAKDTTRSWAGPHNSKISCPSVWRYNLWAKDHFG
jgi:hypothetical protein